MTIIAMFVCAIVEVNNNNLPIESDSRNCYKKTFKKAFNFSKERFHEPVINKRVFLLWDLILFPRLSNKLHPHANLQVQHNLGNKNTSILRPKYQLETILNIKRFFKQVCESQYFKH